MTLEVNNMKTRKLSDLFPVLVLAFAFVSGVFAQDETSDEAKSRDVQRPMAKQPRDLRNNALRQLGLSREQMQQIRRLNADRRPIMVEAQNRFRLANRAVDEAIYADLADETLIQARLKEVQLAQAEVAKIRFMNEFAVRKILTPEQLSRFRELRLRFEQTRRNSENQSQSGDDRRVNGRAHDRDVISPRRNPPPLRRVLRQNQQRPEF